MLLSRNTILLSCFFFSGVAALIFQLCWTRLLLLSLGSTATAISIVLAAFMGGMAIGSASSTHSLFLKRNAISTFAILEAGIGFYALLSPVLLSLVSSIPYESVRFVSALLSLLPATTAMGASLPLLVRALAHKNLAIGLGQLYASNTAGAVVGPLLSVFFLFPYIGLTSTLWFGAIINILIATTVLAWQRYNDFSSTTEKLSVNSNNFVSRPVLLSVAVSGFSAMVYEVAWGRTLSMVYGSSIYGVTIMLSTFLLGLTIGTSIATLQLKRKPQGDPLKRLAKVLIASAILAFTSLIITRNLPFLFLNFYNSIQGMDETLFVSQFIIASLLILPCTIVLGFTLPFAVNTFSEKSNSLNVATLYTWNLIGSATGAVITSLLLFTNLGVEFTIRVAAAAVLLTALFLVFRTKSFSVPIATISSSATLIILALDPSGERLMKSFGVYSSARTYGQYNLSQLRNIVDNHKLLYYRDGSSATVAVQQVEQFKLLKINGKTDASNGPGDMATQLLLGHLPFLTGEAKHVALIGWGSGMTAGAVLKHPVQKIDAFEIEPAVVEASRLFEPDNGTPLLDQRLELVLGDARSELKRRKTKYDFIISEPSNPWLTGVSNLFTLDFFKIARSHLSEDGVLCQWFHLYGMSEESTKSLLATFQEVFPHVIVFKDRDLILLGSSKPLYFSMDRLDELYQTPSIADSLILTQMRYPSDVLTNMTLDSEGVKLFSETGTLNTDDNMLLELQAPRSLYRDSVELIQRSMHRFPPDVMTHLKDVKSKPALYYQLAASYFTQNRYDLALSNAERAVAIKPSFEAQKLLGQILERLNRYEEARKALRVALTLGGSSKEHRFIEAMMRSLNSSHPRDSN